MFLFSLEVVMLLKKYQWVQQCWIAAAMEIFLFCGSKVEIIRAAQASNNGCLAML